MPRNRDKFIDMPLTSLKKETRLCLGDAPHRVSKRELWRWVRRSTVSNLLERRVLHRRRVFCQNSGGCGSTYIVKLLQDNGIQDCYHEKTPDLNEVGLEYFESRWQGGSARRVLRYTRWDVCFEANNRLFSLTQELARAFPNARFIHLHRDGREAVESAMSKPNLDRYLATNIRFQGTLGGPKNASPFERFCHYWHNSNRRIIDDLERLPATNVWLSLGFQDMVEGNLGPLASFLGTELAVRRRPPVNVRPDGDQGRYPPYRHWPNQDQETFWRISGDTMDRLGYR